MRNEASLRPWRHLLLVLAWLLAWVATAVQAAEIYRIDSVPVDAAAESGVAARDLAIANGQREGLIRLMQRLTSPTEHARLPATSGIPIEG